VVKTLDTIHIARARLLREGRGEEVLFATHDRQQSRPAGTLGFMCVG